MDAQAENTQPLEIKNIHELIAMGDTTAISDLLNNSPESLNEISEQNLSVFEALLNAGYTVVAKALIELDAFDVNHQGHNPLRIAVATGNIDIAQRLLELGASPNYRPEGISSALLLALENEYFDFAAQMVKHGAEVDIRNAQGWTPLIWASMKGRQKAVEFLLAHGANIHACNNDGWNAVTGAYFKKRTTIVDLLIKQGAVFGAKYAEAALLSAYDNGYKDVVTHLLEDMHTTPNIADEKNISLLSKAVEKGDWSIVKVLLEKGADVNVMSSAGLPLITELAKNGHAELIELFLQNGADIHLASASGRTALYEAALNNQLKTIKLLAEKGANINHQTNTGWTALMAAASKGLLKMVELLLELGVNTELKTDKGSTAKSIALSNAPKHGQLEKVHGRHCFPLLETAFSDIAEKLTLPGHYVDD